MGRDDAGRQAEAAEERARQADVALTRLQAQQAQHADLSRDLAMAASQNKELAAQLAQVTTQSSQVSGAKPEITSWSQTTESLRKSLSDQRCWSYSIDQAKNMACSLSTCLCTNAMQCICIPCSGRGS